MKCNINFYTFVAFDLDLKGYLKYLFCYSPFISNIRDQLFPSLKDITILLENDLKALDSIKLWYADIFCPSENEIIY